MKILNEKTEVLSNFDGEVDNFKIDPDNAFIFGLLRKSIYSDPLKAAIQEYASNCRDANREVGKSHIPIEITINSSEGYIVFKDDGPGISENRMKEVFLWYGRSSKRDDNRQTGGFGLGCKIGLAIADAFNITTKVDGFKYEYCAYIDESSKGALKLVSKQPLKNNESTGTEIRIPIGRDKCNIAAQHVRELTQWWAPTAILHGFPKILNIKPALHGTGWVMLDQNTRYSLRQVPVCICDGIPFYVAPPSSAQITIPNGVIPIFKTGDVQISANRETFYWSDITITKFKEHIENFNKEYKKIIEDSLNGMTEWYDKAIYLNNVINLFGRSMISNIKYKDPVNININLTDDSVCYNMKGYKYKDSVYSREFKPYYTLSKIVKFNVGYNDGVGYAYAGDLMTFAKDIKAGAIVIENDIVSETYKETNDQIENFKTVWEKYEKKLDEYTNGVRKSRPSRPSFTKSVPSHGVLTNEMNRKVSYFINEKYKNKNIHSVYVVTLNHNELPLKHHYKLSEIQKVVLPVKPKEKRVKNPDVIPSNVNIYSTHRHYYEIDKIIAKSNIYIKFPRQEDLMNFVKNEKLNFSGLYDLIYRKFGRMLFLITENEFKSINKYVDHHKSINELVSIEDWLDKLFKNNPHLLYTNGSEYNHRIKTLVNDTLKNLIIKNGCDDSKQLIGSIQQVTHNTKINLDNKEYQAEEFLRLRLSVDFLGNSIETCKKVLDKYPVQQYNVNTVERNVQQIHRKYPLLKFGSVSPESHHHWSEYLKLINERKSINV